MNGTRGILIAVVASLIVGFALGMMGGIVFMRFGPPPPFVMHHGGPGEWFGPMGLGPGARMGPRPLLAHLDRALDLTPEQHQHILTALEHLRAEHLALRDSTHAIIERELTDAQRARWRDLEKRFRSTWRGRTGRPLPDMGRPPGEPPDSGEGR